ncbi:unnamed protein product [Effrenium voratum]|nr:unnamed protein product [Effrenium voratum]
MPRKKVPLRLPRVRPSRDFPDPEPARSTASAPANPFDADISELWASKDEWSIQGPEDIIQEAKRSVQARKQCPEPDDALETKPWEHQDTADKGYHIILPDNRVVAVENQLSRRLCDELLGNAPREPKVKEELELREPKPRRRQAPDEVYITEPEEPDRALGGRRKMRNPWYLPPTVWYNGEMGKDPKEQAPLGFPYDTLLGESRLLMWSAPIFLMDWLDEAPPIGDKDISQLLDTAKKHFQAQGHRLPHFLQVAM